MGSTAGKIERSLSGLAVIVLGVLLALWAEAAWAERGSRLREREVVSDLLAEFRGNEVLLRADIENNTRTKTETGRRRPYWSSRKREAPGALTSRVGRGSANLKYYIANAPILPVRVGAFLASAYLAELWRIRCIRR